MFTPSYFFKKNAVYGHSEKNWILELQTMFMLISECYIISVDFF